MRATLIIGLILLSTASAVAENAKPEPTYSPTLTANEIQIINAALEIAASSCAVSTNGCVVGMNKAAIEQKLQASVVKK